MTRAPRLMAPGAVRYVVRCAATLLAALGISFGAQAASTLFLDYSDIWWNAGESGWGAGITLQEGVLFLTLFVQGSDRAPVFFTSDMTLLSTPDAPSVPTFAGTLYRSTGPYFGGPYTPAASTTSVGTARLEFTGPGSAKLVYSVDGTTVTKQITRQTFKLDTLAGSYKGGLFARGSGCTGADGFETQSYPGSFNVTQAGTSVTIESTFTPTYAEGGSCKLTGTYVQEGRIASITQGTITCEFVNGPTPTTASFTITGIEFGENGFAGTYTAREGASCTWNGRFGGIRRGYADALVTPER